MLKTLTSLSFFNIELDHVFVCAMEDFPSLGFRENEFDTLSPLEDLWLLFLV